MTKTLDALDVRRRLGEVLNEVRYGQQSVIVRRAGKPMAAIMPIEVYEALTSIPDDSIELYSAARIKEFRAADTKPAGA